MLYVWLKFIHVLSSTVLFGTGIGTACNLFIAHRTRDISLIAAASRYVVIADWLFTGTSGVIQPLSGFAMIYVAGYPLASLWILGSITGYVIAACCWFPVVYLQIRMRDMAVRALKDNTPLPPLYYRYFNYWFILGWPAFISLIVVFYLMTAKPL
ncbi:hypothetical protein AQUSIP_02220 [Aquicella siphonis]|uniref:Integral membrane protein n=1 Tax=Aquicella siphonis TaxID=254247 RepID=A0A5E4PEN7_9COXI|nr:DUF2269 domain-containing protein [Aquicella siphonis]VVC74948.1 hypothetical protein AQUSIP_02220 [Aquicella siphonis]